MSQQPNRTYLSDTAVAFADKPSLSSAGSNMPSPPRSHFASG